MASCDVCGTEESMPYECRRCGDTFCTDHRLPEHHDCPGLNRYSGSAGSGRLDSDFASTTTTAHSRSEDSLLTEEPTPGGLAGYVRNNMAYVFLLAIWITFLLQQLVLAVSGHELHRTLFVLEADNLLHVWSYVTSVFAHSPDGLAHVAFNSLVLYFFGPQLERTTGSKRFSLLFLGSGIIAGGATALVYTQIPIATGSLGASGAVLGVLGALAVLNPSMRVMLLIPPVPLSLRTLVGLVVVVSAVFIVVGAPFAFGINHIAHLVGLLVGLGYGYRLKQAGLQPPQQVRIGTRRGPGRGRF